jgi:hypothetical protein
MATGWLKPHGALGFLALGGLAFAGYALSQAQNWEALLRLLGRGPKPPDPPPAPRNETRGTNSPVIKGGTFTAERDLVIGEKHEHTHLPPPPKPELPESHTPHNLPERTTSPDRFVGWADELKTLAELLAPEGSRAYLTGMGGMGKSELAIHTPTTTCIDTRAESCGWMPGRGCQPWRPNWCASSGPPFLRWCCPRTRDPQICSPCVGASGRLLPTRQSQCCCSLMTNVVMQMAMRSSDSSSKACRLAFGG